MSAVWEEVVDVLLAAERDTPGEPVTITPRQRDLLLDMIDNEWGPLDNTKIRRRVKDDDDLLLRNWRTWYLRLHLLDATMAFIQ